MQFLDRTGVGTLWSICKEKFALTGHTHNYAGSGSPGGSANSAIGVVDYNNTDKTIQIGYYGAGISGDEIKYIAGYTSGGGDVNAKIKDVSKDALKSWLGLGSLAYNSSIDWSQISGFPMASETTLGGIKVAGVGIIGNAWPIVISDEGIAATLINGLRQNDQGQVSGVVLSDGYKETYYNKNGINIEDRASKNNINIGFPAKSGIFALLSDIPDASNLCRFNFINSISECKSDRINFLFKNDNSNVDLSHLYNFKDGTILFIYSPHFGYEITCKSDTWYYYGNSKGAGETDYVNSGMLRLAFLYKTHVHLCSFNK